MNWKNLSDKIAAFLFLTLFFGGFSSPVKGQEDPFSQLKKKFEEGAVFNARFHHQSIDSYTRDTVASRGEIWVGRRRYKVQARNQTVVVNGETSLVYDENRNRVILSKYEPDEDDFAPSRILNGVDSTFAVEKEEPRGDHFYIRLVSDDPFAIYQKVEIFLAGNLAPRQIRAVDPVDNVITTTFEEGKFIPKAKDMFSLEYPAGAEVVDMRNE